MTERNEFFILELQNTRKKALHKKKYINGYSLNINALAHEIGAERNECDTLESQE
jgi:hypothetical protein